MRTTSGSMSSLFFSLGILFRADYSAIPAPSFMSNGVSMSRNPELRPGAAPNSSPQCRPRYLGNTPTGTLSPLRHPFPYHFMLPPCRTSPPPGLACMCYSPDVTTIGSRCILKSRYQVTKRSWPNLACKVP
ncbi:hypothetical protein LZ32DRAFT_82091 [Colletotrichum eremochloae]|nr:hypothetical protein LZ32DRAFT_82091 [Colletotrichum eremochloae]